jgi:hypothetical protein
MSKPYSNMNRSELNDSVNDKKALPDMVLKRIIFEAQDRMNKAEANLVYNRLKSVNVNPLNIFRFRIAILECWRLIGEMALDVKILNLYENKYYDVDDCELVLRLYSKNPISTDKLHHLAGYINHCLHVLNLTNLLIDNIPMSDDPETY